MEAAHKGNTLWANSEFLWTIGKNLIITEAVMHTIMASVIIQRELDLRNQKVPK